MGLLVFFLLAIVTLLAAATAWRQWLTTRQAPEEGATWRRTLGFVAVLGSTLQILIFVVFEAAVIVVGNVDYRRRDFPSWAAANVCIAVIAVIASVLGKGRFRFPAAAAALGMTAIWLLLGMAM